ncbi:hypothetical protein ABT040_29835 [Streptomyces sp. NPDC002688]|uniref:hypothetical protein n=1 Tax=Streptomyces sp. NPDC002688 TaxID=3154423 RepID=UPI0033288E16
MSDTVDETGVQGDPDRLLLLLPAHVRARDEQSSGALRALLSVVAGELGVLEQELAGLYDGWFVETCGEEPLSHLAELIGLTEALPDLGEGHGWRTVVANTVSYRRRKGTVAVLEQVAREVTGWQARAVEYFKLLAATAHVNHVRLDRPAVASLRRASRLDHTGGPHPHARHPVAPQDFERGALDPLMRTAEVRGIRSGRGRYGISQLGVFLFPLHSGPVGDADALGQWPQARPDGPGRWTFDVLGRPTPLFAAVPRAEATREESACESDLPVPLRARRLHALLGAARRGEMDARQLPLGVRIGRDALPLLPERLRVCGLEPLAPGNEDQACVDPMTGRLLVFRNRAPLETAEVFVRYHYGALAEVGAGTYDRSEGFHRALEADGYGGEGIVRRIDIGPDRGRSPAEDVVRAQEALAGQPPGATVVIAIGDNASRSTDLFFHVPEGARLVLVAACPPRWEPKRGSEGRSADAACVLEGLRPHLRGSLVVTGEKDSSLVLDGLVIEGDVTVQAGSLARLVLSQCTVTGRIARAADAPPGSGGARRLEVMRSVVRAVDWPEGVHDIAISDSIIDAGPARPAVTAPGAHLTIQASTVRGTLRIRTLDAANTVFDGLLRVEDRQEGGLSHCYVSPGSLTPRRFRCAPASPEHSLITPLYVSEEPGSPLYLALARTCPDAIREGGEGGTEMGAYHHLHLPLRLAAVRRHLASYVPAELEAGIIWS